MLPLFVLLISFFAGLAFNRYVFNRKFSIEFLGRFAMSLMLLVTGSAHFFRTPEMVESLPDVIPFKIELVYFTGFVELLAAIGLLIPKLFRITAILLIAFFICVLPANIIGSLKGVALGGMDNGPLYLLFRVLYRVSLSGGFIVAE